MLALLKGSKVELIWQAQVANWPKDWAKLLMNTTLAALDCLPRGGRLTVATSGDPQAPSFRVTGTGPVVRFLPEAQAALAGDPTGALEGRSVQPYLTYRLATALNAGLTVASGPSEIAFSVG